MGEIINNYAKTDTLKQSDYLSFYLNLISWRDTYKKIYSSDEERIINFLKSSEGLALIRDILSNYERSKILKIIFEDKPDKQTIFQFFLDNMPGYRELNQVTENDALDYLLTDKLELIEPLSIYVSEIKEYLSSKNKFTDIGVVLQRDPKNTEFKIFVLFIRTNIEDSDEELDLYDEIGDLLNSVTDHIVNTNGTNMNDLLLDVTYFLENINEC